MKYFHKCLLVFVAGMLLLSCEKEKVDTPTEKAVYKVTFNAVWSAETHPVDFPPSPHFSGLIGATHKADDVLFMPNTLATEGIKVMAEVGGKSPLTEEINAYIEKGNAGILLSGGGIGNSPGSAEIEFEIQPAFPQVTLVSMLAPSPDWFVAARNVNLIENGQWVESKTVNVQIYDAGTDAGVTFTAANAAENPPITIQEIQTPPLATNGTVAPLGTMVFERMHVY